MRTRHLLAWAIICLCCLISTNALAHIGSPDIFFEGDAGSNRVRVFIQPPPVIPGRAQISVRVSTPGPHHVSVLPVKWDAGRKGSPPPDRAVLVEGETNLYSAELWLMTTGAHGVIVEVDSPRGKGEAVIPVDAIATQRYTMKPWMKWVLGGMAVLLIGVLTSIARAALAEAVLPPGIEPTRRRIWIGRASAVAGLAVILLLVKGGYAWWDKVDRHFVTRKLYQPPEASVTVSTRNGQQSLRLMIDEPQRSMRQQPRLINDHGKLMHLFLIRDHGLDAMAHLHPEARDDRVFDAVLPDLPTGVYRLFADITHSSGMSETISARLDIQAQNPTAPWHHAAMKPDPTDSWMRGEPDPAKPNLHVPRQGGGEYAIEWERPEQILSKRDLTLKFRIRDKSGNPAALDLYMGMPGHAIIHRTDGGVFAHLHPQGTASMAAMTRFAQRELDINAARRLDDVICGLDAKTATVTFPYAFPSPGQYRIWAQFKVSGEVLTAVYDAEVQEGKARTGPRGSVSQ